MTLSERDQRVAAPEIVGIRVGIGPRMNDAELHFVLGLQLAELGAENGGIVRFGEIRGRGGRTDRDMARLGGLT